MREHIERELKLIPGEGFRLSDLGEPMPARVFDSTYHDTADLRLARHRITLRHRAEEGTRLWQLKIPSGAARIELEVPGTPAHPPAEMTDLLVSHLRGEPLVKVARLRTRRQAVRKDGAEIVEDSVAVYEAQRVTRRFREVEVELLDGDERVLQRLERSLRRAGAEPAGVFTPKLHRALDLSFDRKPIQVAADATPALALGSALGEQYRRLLDHDPGTRLGVDPEDLHQMRVATRRARAFLRAARALVEPVWADELRAELGWLGSALGPARDADVLLEHVREEVAGLGERGGPAQGLVVALEELREQARAAGFAVLSEKRYFVLLDRLAQAEHPPFAAKTATRLADLWWREIKRTRRTFAKLDERSPDDELHAARIRVKRARYAGELAAHELGEPGARFVAASKKLQDILGEHQDAAVAEAWILDWGKSNESVGDALQLVVERERKRRKRARRAWPEAWERVELRAKEAQR